MTNESNGGLCHVYTSAAKKKTEYSNPTADSTRINVVKYVMGLQKVIDKRLFHVCMF